MIIAGGSSSTWKMRMVICLNLQAWIRAKEIYLPGFNSAKYISLSPAKSLDLILKYGKTQIKFR
jgi:hypothetical protein